MAMKTVVDLQQRHFELKEELELLRQARGLNVYFELFADGPSPDAGRAEIRAKEDEIADLEDCWEHMLRVQRDAARTMYGDEDNAGD